MRLTGLKEYVSSLAFSPDGHRLAGFNPSFHHPAPPREKRFIWHGDLRHADRPCSHCEDSEEGVGMVAFSRDGRWLAAGHHAGQVAAWDLSRSGGSLRSSASSTHRNRLL